jgi:hypothetical protein
LICAIRLSALLQKWGHELVKKKVPVSIRAVIERINQKLAAKGEILMATRQMKMTQHFGDYYILDLRGNVVDMDVDPEKLARKLRLLKDGEEVGRRELRRKTRPER